MPKDPLARFFQPPAVLVIDDEQGIRYALGRLLEERGFKVHEADEGQRGLQLLSDKPNEISLVICDFKMPGIDGIETLKRVSQLDPDVLRVLLTGYATLQAAIDATNQGLDAFVTKPYQVRELRAKLDELLARRRNALAQRLLGGVPLFGKLPPEMLAQIYPSLTPHKAARGEVLQQSGAHAERLALVTAGEVRLEAAGPDGKHKPVAWLGPGEHFGEAEMAAGEPSPVRAVASLDSELLTLSRDEFARLTLQHPAIGEAVAQSMARRLHKLLSGAPGEEPALVVSCDGVRQPKAPRSLARAIASEGADVALLSLEAAPAGGEPQPAGLSRRVDDGLPIYSAAAGKLSEDDVPRALAHLRKAHRLLVVDLDGGPPAAAKARAHSDRVVDFVLHTPARAEAVITGEPEPRGFKLMLPPEVLEVGGPALRRVARRLLGTTLGLALSAGGARGIAHIGVLRAMQKAGLELDGVAGSSVGACIAGILARGHGVEELERLFSDLALAERSTPFGEKRWEKPRKIVAHYAGDATFDDLVLPFVCNATDLVSGAEAVFDSGPVGPPVCASMCTPGLFPPYYWNGHVYTDGGLVNGLPVDLLQQRGFDLVAAVDLLHVESTWRAPPERGGPIGRLFNAGLPDLAQKLGALQVVLRAIMVSVRHLVTVRAPHCDLVIRPQFPEHVTDDFDPALYAVKLEAGEKAGEAGARDLAAKRAALMARWKRKA